MKIKTILFSLSLLNLVACSSLTHQFDAKRAQGIHKVAIVAFEIHQQKPADNLGIGALSSMNQGLDKEAAVLKKMGLKVANNFSAQIEKKTKWQVLPINTVIANPAYKERVAGTMTGMRSVTMVGPSYESIYPDGLLDMAAFRKLTLEERAKLAKDLGVDALAEVNIMNNIEQSRFSLGHAFGGGSFAFSGSASLEVYDVTSNDPVWRSQNVSGEVTEKSEDLSDKMSKIEKLSTLGEKASNMAISKLVESYSL
ncbi:MAG: hypothetical protein Q7U04_01150 [Bacteriovorax sp.]|nr:hypothetical protein [Bacteriovorax sp.]